MTHDPQAINAALETLLPEGGWGCSWNENLELEQLSFDDHVQDPPTLEQVLSQAEIESTKIPWKRLRQKRDQLMFETDWWASSDRTMTDEQRAYRQALRDLPANTTDPENPIWPTKPE